MSGLTVPGYDVEERLGSGWAGELWAARGRATGRRVVLRRVQVPDDPASRDRLRRGAAVLAGLEHPHVVRLRGVVAGADSVVLVSDFVDGDNLAHLLASRTRLDPGEVVTLTVPLAQALAAAHDRGLVHGRLTPSAVLLAQDGRPMLADIGVSGLLDRPSGHSHETGVADDVRALAATCRAALAGTGPGDAALVAALDAAARGGARDTTARDLAAALFAAAQPAPIRRQVASVVRPDTAPADAAPPVPPAAVARPRGGHRAPPSATSKPAWRRWVAALLGAAALAMATLTGLAWAGADSGAPASGVPRSDARTGALVPATPQHTTSHGPVPRPSAAAGARPVRWQAVLAALDARRAEAFATWSARRLAQVYAPGSPALDRDRVRLAHLVGAGLTIRDVTVRATSVRVVGRSAGRVALRVVDVLSPYDLRDSLGSVVEHHAGRGAATWTVTLVHHAGGWRVYDVVAA